jgi:ABC-type multidrug transport system fused ATPase/permease subunit
MAAGIEVTGLTVARAGRDVLRDVSFRAPRGRVLALVGASGSGKSTLLRCLNRLAEAEAGVITLDGEDIRSLDPPALRRRVALVAQAPVMLPGTVADNLAYGLPALVAAAAREALVASGLDESFLGRVARALSGGERARVALARALTRSPDAILLDEPTAALDPDTARHVAETFASLARRDLVVILATHDRPLAADVAHDVLTLSGGSAVAGPVEALLAAPSARGEAPA